MPDGISELHQAIGQEALALAGDSGWHRLRIECLLDGRSTDILFACDDATAETGYVTRMGRLPELFVRLADAMQGPGNARWTRCAATVEPDGAFRFAFSY